MPVRPLDREQGWLLPHSLDELLAPEHPARFVGAFVDALGAAALREIGLRPDGDALGAPAYHPRLLLSVWLYGFMTGVRSSRKLETACREQLPYLWLTGLQTPDHNTLWRFYEEHRQGMRRLLKRTVKIAVKAGLVNLAVQAVDGSKLAGNAAKDRTYTAEGLRRLLSRTEAAIADLEAQNRGGEEAVAPRLPQKLRQKQALAQKVREALAQVEEEERVNLTDMDAVLLRGKDGYVAGYNAQAVVSPLSAATGKGGLLITAVGLTQDAEDHAQLMPMVQAASDNCESETALTLADAGYHSGENLALLAAAGRQALMPEAQAKALRNPYHKDAFSYDEATDTYTCPQGQTLRYSTQRKDRKSRLARLYRATPAVCRACPAFGQCTKDYRHGRALEIGPDDAALKQHRQLMATADARELYKLRRELVEPAFGIIKEQRGGRRLLLRGQLNALAEWTLAAVGFNLKSLARVWAQLHLLLSILRFRASLTPRLPRPAYHPARSC